jgi:hypothetical protein
MAKFKVPEPKYIAKLKHPTLQDKSGEAIWKPDDTAIPAYFRHKMTDKEYINLLAGAYGHSDFDISQLKKYLNESRHNNEKNNDLALAKVLSHIAQSQGGVKPTSKHVDIDEGRLRHIINDYPISSEAIHHIIDNHDSFPISTYREHLTPLADQKNLNKDHVIKIFKTGADKDIDLSQFINHKLFDKDLADHLIYNTNYKLKSNDVAALNKYSKHNDPSKNLLENRHIKHILDNNKAGATAFPQLLSSIKPSKNLLGEEDHSYRNSIISKYIGHEGAKLYDIDDAEEMASSPDTNYNLMSPGFGYKTDISKEILRNSPHLTPEHIDYIKRHGNFEQKWALFHNKHIDPQHQIEMHNKWANDNHEHGYDLEQLKTKIQNQNDFQNSYDYYYEDARDQAEEEYPLSEYIRDNVEDSDLMDGMEQDEWINNHLAENYNWQTDDDDFTYSIEDHPDYDARRDEAQEAYNSALEARRANPQDHLDDRTMDRIYEGHSESISDDVSRIARRMHDERMENAHLDYDFLPEHLKDKLPAVNEHIENKKRTAEERARLEAAKKEAALKPKLDELIPNRNNTHAYGDLQHHLELAQHYADANGGSIDIGHLNKIHPNIKDNWKKIFGEKGKLSSQELQKIRDSIPKTNYNISYGVWDGSKMQNINNRDQVVVRLDHSNESIAPIKADPNTYKIFQKIQEVSQRSGHPTNLNTIAWARVDTHEPGHWMIDEVQSDFGSAARDYLDQNDKSEEAEHVNKIINYHKNWREALINKVISMAKDNGVNIISTHSPESKASHTNADKVHTVYKESYQKVPRSMGFKPVHNKELPLTEGGRKKIGRKTTGTPVGALLEDHAAGMDTHAWLAQAHKNLAAAKVYPPMAGISDRRVPMDADTIDLHQKLADHHTTKFREHHQRLSNLDPTHALRNYPSVSSYIEGSSSGFKRMNPEEKEQKHNANLVAARMSAKEIMNEGYGMPVYGHDSALKEAPASENHGHQIDLSPPKLKKSIDDADFDMEFEKLQKAPVENTNLESFDGWHDIPKSYKHVSSKQLKNGLYHHTFAGHYGPEKSPIFYHAVSDSKHPHDTHMARVQVSIEPYTNEPIVTESHVNPQHAGHGHGKLAYAAALAHHGRLESDYAVSQNAHKAWQNLNGLPSVNLSIKPMGSPDPNRAMASDVKKLRAYLYKTEDLIKDEAATRVRNGWPMPEHSARTFQDPELFESKLNDLYQKLEPLKNLEFSWEKDEAQARLHDLLDNPTYRGKYSPEVLDVIASHSDEDIRKSIHIHPNAEHSRHIKPAIDRDRAAWIAKVQKALSSSSGALPSSVPVHEDANLDDWQLNWLASHGDTRANNYAINHPNAEPRHIEKAINTVLARKHPYKDDSFWLKLGNNPKTTEDQLMLAHRQVSPHYRTHLSKKLRERGIYTDPNQVEFALGTNKLRSARDHIINNGSEGKMHKKDLELAGHSPQALGISHLLDGTGHIHHEDIQRHIDAQPKMKFGFSKTSYGSEDSPRYLEDMLSDHLEAFNPEDYGVHKSDFLDYGKIKKYHNKQFKPDFDETDFDSHEEYEQALDDARRDWEDGFNLDDYDYLAEKDDKYLDKDSYEREVQSAKDRHMDNFDSGDYGVTHEQAYENALEEQRHTYEPSEVFQLNFTKEHADKMKESGVWGTFKNMQEASKRSKHPVLDNTIGWVRYTQDQQGNTHIDEIQSDFGQSFIKQAQKQIKDALSSGQINQQQAEQAYANAHAKWPEEHYNKINEILFNNKHPNEILHEAFLQHLRDNNRVGSKVHIWDSKEKADLSGMSSSGYINLQDIGKIINNDLSVGDRLPPATVNHAKNWIKQQGMTPENWEAKSKEIIRQQRPLLSESEIESYPISFPMPVPAHMQFTYNQHPKKMGYKPSKYGELETQHNPYLKGKSTWSDTLKKKEKLDPDQIEKLKNLLENVENVDIDMPWNDIIKYSTHRWA